MERILGGQGRENCSAAAAGGGGSGGPSSRSSLARIGVPGAADRLASLKTERENGAGANGGPGSGGSAAAPLSMNRGGSSNSGSASSHQQPDPYLVLGLARTASAAEVRAAYGKLALHFHPAGLATGAVDA